MVIHQIISHKYLSMSSIFPALGIVDAVVLREEAKENELPVISFNDYLP